MGIGSSLVLEAARISATEAWLRDHPEEAKEFWEYVKGVTASGFPMYPTMHKLIKSLGGPPGSENAVRRFAHGQLSKL